MNSYHKLLTELTQLFTLRRAMSNIFFLSYRTAVRVLVGLLFIAIAFMLAPFVTSSTASAACDKDATCRQRDGNEPGDRRFCRNPGNNGECVECLNGNSSQCQAGYTCQAGKCIPPTPTPTTKLSIGTVSITSPTNGTTYPAGQQLITITATGSHSSGISYMTFIGNGHGCQSVTSTTNIFTCTNGFKYLESEPVSIVATLYPKDGSAPIKSSPIVISRQSTTTPTILTPTITATPSGAASMTPKPSVTPFMSNKATFTLTCSAGGTTITPQPSGPTASPSVTLEPSITTEPSITGEPSITISPSISVTPPSGTVLDVSLMLSGIGAAGDSSLPKPAPCQRVNGQLAGGPNCLSNQNPLNPNRNVRLDIYGNENTLIKTVHGTVNYDGGYGGFRGFVPLGNDWTSGSYIVRVFSPENLGKEYPLNVRIEKDQTRALPEMSLISGDVNGDNKLNILDFNIIGRCYTEEGFPSACNEEELKKTDLNDDGKNNIFDWNQFHNEMSVLYGD